jgi:Winged helix DNA-binding domain
LAAELSDRELRLLRWRAQLLAAESAESSVTRVAKAALTIQAQDVGAATLALRARTAGLTLDELRKQGARRSVCRSWLMRNTLFLFASSDLAWMRPLLAPRPMAWGVKRLGQQGVPARKLEPVLAALRERLAEGPISRKGALALIEAQGIAKGVDNRTYWIAHVAAQRGVLVIRPALERVQTFVAAPEDKPLERERALGRLARRYLRAYAPASVRDFAYWGKMTMSDARLGWERAGRLRDVETSQGVLSALPGRLDPPEPERPVVRLLGLWDNYLLGHTNRELVVPKPVEGWIDPRGRGGGLLRQTAFADGLAFGTWRLEREGARLAVALETYDGVPRRARPGLEDEVADIGRFFEAEARLKIVGG